MPLPFAPLSSARLVLGALAAVVLAASASCSGSQSQPARCGEPGQWLVAAEGGAAAENPATLLERMAGQQAVLLGEAHDSAEDHRWQLHTLAQLHARKRDIALGVEMLPRRVQPVLDRWVAGGLSEAEFLQQVEWDKVWGYDPADYLPLFHYARMNRLPVLALNVERGLSEAVGKQGWDAVPEARKEGVSRPAAPHAEYLKALRAVFDGHPARKRGEETFAHFVEAQTVWDRAMAEVIAGHLKQRPDALVVAILGAGHVRHGHGVAHQLRDLGVARVGALLTWSQAEACAHIAPGLADALYVVGEPVANPPRLGVAMEPAKEGIRIMDVAKASVAEQAGLKRGDLVIEAAGRPLAGAPAIEALRAMVRRQAPGTWLPLKVRRGDEQLELVARFPAQP